MALSFVTQTIPLAADEDGVVRVGHTRVTLDTVVQSFCDGATPEEIVLQYPALNLADVYQVISHCLRQPSEIDTYLQRRRTQAETVQKDNEARFDPQGVRDRMLSRRAACGR